MVLSILPLLVDTEAKFIRTPDLEEAGKTFYPGEKASPPWWKAYGHLEKSLPPSLIG